MLILRKLGGFRRLAGRIWKTMITCRLVGPDLQFEVYGEPPLLYLDHWALRRLSENPKLGSRFHAAFERRGTLMFSLMNVVEIGRDASSKRAKEIRDFLEKVGPHWVPMTIDPLRIVKAEDTGAHPDGVHPCLSAAFLSDEDFARCLTNGPVSLVHVVDLTRGLDGDKIRKASDQHTTRLCSNIQDWRNAYLKAPKDLDQEWPLLPFDQDKPMRGIYFGLVRYSIIDKFTLNNNHARDLFHAISSVRCAEMVTLDAHWAGQVKKLGLPPGLVKVYSESEFDQFLADLESLPATR